MFLKSDDLKKVEKICFDQKQGVVFDVINNQFYSQWDYVYNFIDPIGSKIG